MTRLFNLLAPENRHERDLVREIVLVLLVKLTVIALAAVFIFGPSRLPHIDAAKVAAHLFGTPGAALSTNPSDSLSSTPASRSNSP